MNRDINFAQVREDPLIELDLFGGINSGRFFTIMSGGCTALSLLLLKPERVLAVDINPAQDALVALKGAAIRSLDFYDLHAFLGNRDSRNRREVYGDLRNDLAPNHRQYWDGHEDWIAEGIQYAGRAERFYRRLSQMLRLTIHSEARVRSLFECRNLEEQKRFYKDTWCNLRWRTLSRMALSRTIQNCVFDKVVFAQTDESHFGDYFYSVTERAVCDLPTRDNYFLSQIMLGEYLEGPNGAPPYLVESNHESIRAGLDSLETVCMPADRALKQAEAGSLDGFALSNVLDWLTESERESLCRQILRTAKPGARVIYRNLVASPRLPDFFAERVRWDEERSAEYHRRDRSFIYKRLRVGTISN